MPSHLTLYQKILIVKWYYMSKEEMRSVAILFEESFHFRPISAAFDQVLRAFELSGSVVENVLSGIKEEPVTEDTDAEVEETFEIDSDIHDDEPMEQFSEEEPLSEESAATKRIKKSKTSIKYHTKVDGKLESAVRSKNTRIICKVCGKGMMLRKMKVNYLFLSISMLEIFLTIQDKRLLINPFIFCCPKTLRFWSCL